MTRFVFFLVFLFAGSAYAGNGPGKEADGINWLSIEEAQTLGKKEPKKVFVDVYTNWCGFCKKMDANTFSNPTVVKYVNENFYAVKLNAESRKMVSFNGTVLSEAELARAFRVSGYPTIVFIDETFRYIQPVPGYREASEFHKILLQFNGEKVEERQLK